MSKTYDAEWENALTVVQEAQPPTIPEGAHAMTVVIEYPPGSAGAPPHRHPGGPAFGYMLEGEMLFELEGQPPRHEEPLRRDDALCSRPAHAHPRRRRGARSAQAPACHRRLGANNVTNLV